MGRHHQIDPSSAYTLKLLNDQMQNDQQAAAVATLNDQKKLMKYLQTATQSQTNTPRMMAKNLQNRVKSEHNTNTCCSSHHQQQPHFNQQPQNVPAHQMIAYLSSQSDTTHQDQLAANEAIRNFLVMQQQQDQQPNSSSTPIPSLPLAPPPSLASALLTQHQQKQLIENYNNYLLSTLSRSQQQQSPVQYNMPWQQTIDQTAKLHSASSAFRPQAANSNTSSLISNLTGQTTLSRAQQGSSTFTAQQYANRALKQQQQQQQQEYSSISPVEDMTEAELEELEYKRNQTRQQQTRAMPMIHSWNSDGNAVSSSSYESQNNPNSSTSLNSSDLSASKQSSSDDSTHQMGQHYANHDLENNGNYLNDEKKRFLPIQLKNNENKSFMNEHNPNEMYLSEMPQTIL